jgi:hypothetical protein
MSLTTQHITRSSARSIKTAAHDNVASAGQWLRAAMADPNLFVVLAFSAIGLLVTLNVVSRFPNFSMTIQ